jgi:hypothetical protein
MVDEIRVLGDDSERPYTAVPANGITVSSGPNRHKDIPISTTRPAAANT